MIGASQIKEQMEVKDSDGKHLGTVDSLEGERVKIASGGMHHFIDLDVVENVKDGVVRLTQTKDEAMRTWH